MVGGRLEDFTTSSARERELYPKRAEGLTWQPGWLRVFSIEISLTHLARPAGGSRLNLFSGFQEELQDGFNCSRNERQLLQEGAVEDQEEGAAVSFQQRLLRLVKEISIDATGC